MSRYQTRPLLMGILLTLGPVILAVVVSLVIITLLGKSPVDALIALLTGSFGGRVQLARTISYLLPLSAVALAWIVSFRTGRINIGFQGQIIVGGIAGTIVGIYVSLPAVIHITLALVAGALAGMFYAWIAGYLWAKRNVNEIISTLMLNLIALELITWLIRGPLQESRAYARTAKLMDSSRWPTIISYSALTWDIILLPIFVFAVWFMLNRTTLGMAMRLTGANPNSAFRAGLQTSRVTVGAFLIGGAISGVTGSSLVLSGEMGRMAGGFARQFGIVGIVVALLARNNPLAVVPAAALFAVLDSGAGLMESRVGVPNELVTITQGIVILTVAGGSILAQRVTRDRRSSPPVSSSSLSSSS